MSLDLGATSDDMSQWVANQRLMGGGVGGPVTCRESIWNTLSTNASKYERFAVSWKSRGTCVLSYLRHLVLASPASQNVQRSWNPAPVRCAL